MSAPASTSSSRCSSRLSKGTAHISKNPPHPGSPQMLYLRVNRKFLLLLPASMADQPNAQSLPPLPGTTGNLNVIVTNLSDLHPFAGDSVGRLNKVARLIFEPLRTSSLYTFTTESLEWWLTGRWNRHCGGRWCVGEQLRATIYEFRPDNHKQDSSSHQATNTSLSRAATFRDALLRRDRACIITQHTLDRAL
jgi:hypothetical protein